MQEENIAGVRKEIFDLLPESSKALLLTLKKRNLKLEEVAGRLEKCD